MKFMLHCRKFCPEIRVSRVAKGMSTPVVRTGSPGQAGLKNVEGKAQRRRQYASTARSCNAAIGIFSGPRLRPAILKINQNLRDTLNFAFRPTPVTASLK